MTDDKKLIKYFNRKLTNKEVLTELHLDFSQPGKAEDLKFSRETPAPYIPPTYSPTVPSDYLTERPCDCCCPCYSGSIWRGLND